MTYKNNIIFQLDLLHRKLMLKANKILRPEVGLNAGSFFMLAHLCNMPTDNHTMIGAELFYERSTISRAMSVMSERGYVITAKTNDQRCNVYKVTELGRQLVKKYVPAINKLSDELLMPNGDSALTHAYVAIKDYNERAS